MRVPGCVRRYPEVLEKCEEQCDSMFVFSASNAAEFDDLPPAGKVELVHVKKRKCGCCTVQ